MTETTDLVLSEISEVGILRLTLNDSGRRNALSVAMIETLHAALESAASNDEIRVIILAATGPAFCAGHDLKEITAARETQDGGDAFFQKLMNDCSNLMVSIVQHPKPIIAEVAGVATAAGCQLVASCDLAVAASTARFATPGVNIGLFCSTPMVALSRNVSNKHAMEMLLTGDMVSADHAAEIGLINRHVNIENLTDATTEIATKIAAKSRMTVSTGKKAYYRQREMALTDAYSYTANVMVENLLKDDAKEGIGAFVEKRPPVWQDK